MAKLNRKNTWKKVAIVPPRSGFWTNQGKLRRNPIGLRKTIETQNGLESFDITRLYCDTRKSTRFFCVTSDIYQDLKSSEISRIT